LEICSSWVNNQALARIILLRGRKLCNKGGRLNSEDTANEDTAKVDSAMVAALYVEHAEELQRFLAGVLRDPQLAADALQAAFVKMVERGHNTQAESRKAWLFRVAYHEAIALRRKDAARDRATRKLEPLIQNGSAENHPLNTSSYSASLSSLVRMEEVEAVRAAIDKLPAPQREIVRLRMYEDKRFAEIAAQLNIPLGTALARMRAALEKLRIALHDHE